MPVTDPISDLLTRLRNAARARKTLVHVPYSNMKASICKVLKEKGYVLNLQVTGEGVTKELVVEIPENRQDLTYVPSVNRVNVFTYTQKQFLVCSMDLVWPSFLLQKE